ncbi:hypothetical protein DRW41_17180 [Neobacillus piezotolerans]|uniref:Uncharacterized protein n=1 Tax=Neobacillus piezotolerans TaxID=2259171 RepID=A0A3D8GM20_9BACI|nr:hypothetical protein [Neobacillus piezotolerans]RDU35473.1 hypothetical protein DRW41_17180 [Neobacillus piezotolerans]
MRNSKKLKKKFPFHQSTDEEIEQYLKTAKLMINQYVRERDFDIHIVAMGITLVQLEEEAEIRKVKH